LKSRVQAPEKLDSKQSNGDSARKRVEESPSTQEARLQRDRQRQRQRRVAESPLAREARLRRKQHKRRQYTLLASMYTQ